MRKQNDDELVSLAEYARIIAEKKGKKPVTRMTVYNWIRAGQDPDGNKIRTRTIGSGASKRIFIIYNPNDNGTTKELQPEPTAGNDRYNWD